MPFLQKYADESRKTKNICDGVLPVPGTTTPNARKYNENGSSGDSTGQDEGHT